MHELMNNFICLKHVSIPYLSGKNNIIFGHIFLISTVKNMQKIRFLLKWTNIYICKSCVGSFYCHSWWTFGIAPQLATTVLSYSLFDLSSILSLVIGHKLSLALFSLAIMQLLYWLYQIAACYIVTWHYLNQFLLLINNNSANSHLISTYLIAYRETAASLQFVGPTYNEKLFLAGSYH